MHCIIPDLYYGSQMVRVSIYLTNKLKKRD